MSSDLSTTRNLDKVYKQIRQNSVYNDEHKMHIVLYYYSIGNAMTCDDDAFACGSGDKCIPKIWKCDSEHDCLDGSDEVDCGRK